MRGARLAAGSVCAFALLIASPARAFERQQHLGLDVGGGVLSTNGGSAPFGWSVGAHYTYGLLDSVNLVVEAAASGTRTGPTPAKNPPPQPGFVVGGGAGAVYVFDVLRWVPYAGGIFGPAYLGGGYLSGGFATPDLQLAVGLDYQLSRTWTVGVAYRQHFFLAKMNDYPEFTTVGLRFEYTWGW